MAAPRHGASLRAVVLAFVLALAACVPTSRHPLTAPQDAVKDGRLIGLWTGMVDDERVYFHFIDKGDEDLHAVGASHGDGDRRGGWSAYGIRTARLGATWYLTAEVLVEDGKSVAEEDDRYLLCRYQITASGELEVWLMSEEPVILDIEAGKIAGQVDEGRFATEIELTAPSAELAAYVAAADPERVFGDLFLTLRRKE
jgi:hypothetical protein